MFCARKYYRLWPILLFSALIATLQSPASYAQKTLNDLKGTEDLYQLALHIEEYLGQLYPLRPPFRSIKLSVKKPDPRLKLKRCDNKLTLEARSKPVSGGAISVEVSCNSTKPWSIFISALVEIEAPIVHVTRDLPRGHILTEEDLHLKYSAFHKQKNGALHAISDGLGQELKRSIRASHVVRQSAIQPPNIVARGDTVSLRARVGHIEVVTSGTALSDGRLGRQIRIRNNSSNKVVRAKITGPDSAEVIL